MKIRNILIAVALTFSVVGCSNEVSKKDLGNGTCEQTNEVKFFGVTFGTDRSLLNC